MILAACTQCAWETARLTFQQISADIHGHWFACNGSVNVRDEVDDE